MSEKSKDVVVFVSGCYDMLHAGHISFFEEARRLGTKLVVSVANDEVFILNKNRLPTQSAENKAAIISSLRFVDEVFIGNELDAGLDFKSIFRILKPDFLVVNSDDKFEEKKRLLCSETGTEYIMLDSEKKHSSTEIMRRCRIPSTVPLRVDFAGGWLDVPKLSRHSGFIVNCSISPRVSFNDWPYQKESGLGGSAAWSILKGEDAIESELAFAGWQDAAVINETGLCVWRSGSRPSLDFKSDGSWLNGRMAIYWSGQTHRTANHVQTARDYDAILEISREARESVLKQSVTRLKSAIHLSYQQQLAEGMNKLPDLESASMKYCGSGHGGYAVYLFDSPIARDEACKKSGFFQIEPFYRLERE